MSHTNINLSVLVTWVVTWVCKIELGCYTVCPSWLNHRFSLPLKYLTNAEYLASGWFLFIYLFIYLLLILTDIHKFRLHMELTLIIRQATSDILTVQNLIRGCYQQEHTIKKIKIPFICDVMPCLVETFQCFCALEMEASCPEAFWPEYMMPSARKRQFL